MHLTMMRHSQRVSARHGCNMKIQQWKTSLVILLYLSMQVKAFSNPPLPQMYARGGAASQGDEEDQAIDDYIEDLIASVDSSSESSSEDVRDEIDLQEIVDDSAMERVGKKGKEQDETEFDADVHVQDSNDKVGSFDVSPENKAIRSRSDVGEEEGNPQEGNSNIKTTKKRRKKRSLTEEASETNEEKSPGESVAIEEEVVVEEEADTIPQRPLGPARPNALYRFLLNRGRIGHILVLICVLIVELIQTYIPPLAYLLGAIFSFLSPSDEIEGGTSYRRGPRGPVQKVNAQYAAFVTSDGSSVRGKQRKKQARKADEQAAEKLRRVGSIQDAKFRHVSVDFMKRHRIGSYRDSENGEELVVYEERAATMKTPDGEDEEESDIDWVVEALTTEQEQVQEEELSSSIGTSFGVGLDNEGATISVGVQFGAPKKKKRRKTLAEAAIERTPKPKKKPAGPRTSDRDGGGGVLGRIRAAGANSLVSRSLLGAYPGDAVPPSEAGSAYGVTALAEKYGYGDWSDEDDEEEEDVSFGSSRRKATKRTSQRKRKSSKPSSSGSSGGVNFSFGVSTSSSTRTRTAPTRKRPSGTTRKKDSLKTPEPSTEKSDILTGRPSTSPPERKRVQVRPPLEKLNAARENAKRRKEDED